MQYGVTSIGYRQEFNITWRRVCHECTSGKEYDCNSRQVWGFQTGPLWGGFAQYTHMSEVNVVKIPDNAILGESIAKHYGFQIKDRQ